MRTPIHPAIRTLLRQHPDGLTTADIGRLLGRDSNDLTCVLKAMPDTYIDRWQPRRRGQRGGRLPAVWCIIEVPEDCPYPTSK